MSSIKTYNIKQILIIAVWVLLATSAIVLLVAAIKKRDDKKCNEIVVSIIGSESNFFIEKNDVLEILKKANKAEIVGCPIGKIDLRLLETELEKNTWIKKAELFFDNKETLKVNIEEKIPVARIFSLAGTSFYIDSTISKLPLSDKFSARLPIFTGFQSDKATLSSADSVVLNQVKLLSMAIQKDSFLMAMIEQVDITPQATFDLIPKIGNQVIQFGAATEVESKMLRLKLFYKQVMAKESWNKYSSINLQYANQIVAKRRDATDISADSLKAIQIMQLIAANAERQAGDSLQTMQQDNSSNSADSTIILQSLERDDEGASNQNASENPKPQDAVTSKPPVVVKPVNSKPVVNPNKPVKPTSVKPKAIMKNKN
ncbi:MAG: hypothetical protein IPP48_06895 [Chitinophagaceae bacterium]|nr:hypothetical protein [Chitinophagaceae bacterium]